VIGAIVRARKSLDFWPSPWTYELWASIERRVRRVDPGLPVLKTIDNTFGDWDTAVDAARRAWRRVHIAGV
jgi:hypothetical protein